MAVDPPSTSVDEPLLDEIIAQFLQAEEAGETPDPRTVLAAYPALRESLEPFFARHLRLSRLMQPLRDFVQATRGSTDSSSDPTGPWQMRGAESAEPRPGSLGNYELLDELGRGGMGVVYRARQRIPQRLVALKMIRSRLLASPGDIQRFRNEAETIALLDHPGIVPLYEVGSSDEHLYFCMKLIEGGNLAASLPRYRHDSRAAARLVSEIARAVHHAHQRGVLHRDLKPSNILLDASDRPYVTDFGLAKRTTPGEDGTATQTGLLLGTPGYMAPEQASGGGRLVTTATDVYGLGAILYALLTSEPPFQGTAPLETLTRVLTCEPRKPRAIDPRIDRDLETICLCCLSKDASRRYPSAEALAEDLDRWLDHRPIKARPVSRWERTYRWCRYNPVASALVASLLLLFLVGTVLPAVALILVEQERRTADRHRQEAETNAAYLRRQLYAADLGRAHRLWQHGDLNGVADVLGRYASRSDEEDLRGFEWYFLQRWNEGQVRELRAFHGHHDIIFASTFSPDGSLIASGGADQDVRLWKTQTGECVAVLSGHQDDINALCFTPDGQLLASASDDGTIRLWDVKTKKEVGILRNPSRVIETIAFTPDAKLLLSAGLDAIIRIWDLKSRSIVGELTGHQTVPTSRGGVEAIALSPDGKILLSGGHDGTYRSWDLPTRRQISQSEHWATVLATRFAANGSRHACATRAGFVSLFRSSQDSQASVSFSHDQPMRCLSFSHDDELLAAGGDDGRIRLWNVSQGRILYHFRGHDGPVWSLAFAPNEKSLLTAGNDRTLRLWEIMLQPMNRPLRAAEDGYFVRSAFTNDNRTLVVWNQKGTVEFWDPAGGHLRERVPLWKEMTLHPHAIRVALAPDSRTWAVGDADGSIHVRDMLRQRPPTILPRQAPPTWKPTAGTTDIRFTTSITFSPDSQRLAVLYHAGTIKIWDLTTLQVQNIKLDLEPPSVAHCWERMIFTPDGKTLIVVDNRAIRFWDLEQRRFRDDSIPLSQPTNHLSLTPDGHTLALAGVDRTVRLIDLRFGTIRTLWRVHQREVTGVAFSPDGRTLASSSLDGSVRLWLVATGEELFAVEDSLPYGPNLSSVAFSPDGQILATAGNATQDGSTVRLWFSARPDSPR